MKLSDVIKNTGGTVIDRLYRTKFTYPREVVKFLRENGFKKLGGGVYSDVFGRAQDPYVIKISKQYDPCFLKYGEWISSQANNPYVPNFEWYKIYESAEGERLIILPVEKLRPITFKDLKNIEDPAICVGLLKYGDFFRNERFVLLDSLERLGHLTGNLNNEKLNKLADRFSSHQFVRTLMTVQKKFADGVCSLDLHSGNFMIRPSTNTVVITDPLAQ